MSGVLLRGRGVPLQAEWMDEWLRKDQIIVDEDYGALVASPEGDGTQQEGPPPLQQL